MSIPARSAGPGSGFPTLEDAVRAGHARGRLARRIGASAPLVITYVDDKDKVEHISLPPAAVVALHRILAHLAAGRSVQVVPVDSEMELDDAALLIGHDPLAFLEAVTQLGIALRTEGSKVYLGTASLARCMAAIHGDCPEELAPSSHPVTGQRSGRPFDAAQARDLLAGRAWDFVKRLGYDLKKAGNKVFPDLSALDFYFGRRDFPAIRPKSWPDPEQVRQHRLQP